MVEMMMSLTILGMISLALGASTLQTRKSSESAVFSATAAAAVSSYLEQIKSMDYPNLVNAVMSPATNPLPTQIDDATNDFLYVGQANIKSIPVDTGSNGVNVSYVRLTITPTLTDLTATTGLTAIEILLTYTWIGPDSKTPRSRAMRTVRSFVPSF